jgi:hypothetical protein
MADTTAESTLIPETQAPATAPAGTAAPAGRGGRLGFGDGERFDGRFSHLKMLGKSGFYAS